MAQRKQLQSIVKPLAPFEIDTTKPTKVRRVYHGTKVGTVLFILGFGLLGVAIGIIQSGQNDLPNIAFDLAIVGVLLLVGAVLMFVKAYRPV